jgi:protein O-GlcNAc transferase
MKKPESNFPQDVPLESNTRGDRQEKSSGGEPSAEAHYRMAVIRSRQKDWHQCLVHCKKALDRNPCFSDAGYLLAFALKQIGQYDKAIIICQMTLEMAPSFADGHYLQGMCHLALGRHHQAADAILRAIRLEPQNARYWLHLAEARLSSGDTEASLSCYRKVIELRPDWDAAHYNLAVALRKAERIREAIDHLNQALQINPGYVNALPLLFRLAQHICDWDLAEATSRRLDAVTAKEIEQGLKTTEPPLTNLRRRMDPRLNLLVARSWSQHHLSTIQQLSDRPVFEFPTDLPGRIRVAYLSSDYKDHAVAHQIRGLLESHDRSRFEIFGYACNPDDRTSYRRKLVEACDHFQDVHAWSNRAVARKINADGIHILVDLAGHTCNNRMGITAMQPAPIRVGYLGFLGTTGADFMDYVLADTIVVPPSHAAYYTEKIVYLPHCYQANDDRMPLPGPLPDRWQWHLPDGAFVYCSFNQPYKIDADLFQRWMRILKRVNQSVLWLVRRDELACDNLRRAAECAGVDPARLIFTGFVPLEENLTRLQLADLVLDTLTYNGGATTANALWAGVPVLTVPGGNWVSRMSASALAAVGLPELVAGNRDEYEERAAELAFDPHRLGSIRRRLQHGRSNAPLFHTTQFTRLVEKGYIRMWHRYCEGLPPVSFSVDP